MPNQAIVNYPTWDEVTQDECRCEVFPLQALLIQAIAVLSTQTRFERMTPSKVYDWLVRHTQDL